MDPSTRQTPGFTDQPRGGPADRTRGAKVRHDADGNEVVGHRVLGPEMYGLTRAQPGFISAPPEFHIVDKGDTLWAICQQYFRDPYLWPKIWSFNEQITNAHWIFPGDRVRLSDPFSRQDEVEEAAPRLRFSRADYRPPDTQLAHVLNQFAYIDEAQLEHDMEVIGGARAKVMMADMDTAYIGYDPARPPVAGERLAVYEVQRPIYDLSRSKRRRRRHKKGKRLGYLVEIVGEVYVQSLAKKSAEAKIVDSLRPIERGYKVGELRNRFLRVRPVEAQVSDVGAVVDVIREVKLAGEYQFVIVNMGKARGIVRGNMLEVVHKGDAYSPEHGLRIPYEKGHPRRVNGKILVLQVEERVSLGIVLDSRREIVRGDPVELRVPSMAASEQPTMADTSSGGRSGQARLAGEVKVKIGN
ncbi:MAG: LysM peptidoglycan-binding domain-containing protein [Nannocystaceae bacterium]